MSLELVLMRLAHKGLWFACCRFVFRVTCHEHDCSELGEEAQRGGVSKLLFCCEGLSGFVPAQRWTVCSTRQRHVLCCFCGCTWQRGMHVGYKSVGYSILFHSSCSASHNEWPTWVRTVVSWECIGDADHASMKALKGIVGRFWKYVHHFLAESYMSRSVPLSGLCDKYEATARSRLG